MNAILSKERRSLRPAFIATVAATVLASLIFNGNEASGFVITVFTIGVALMAASSFGNEFHTRTMLLLLAQPVPRRWIWFEKMQVLAVELVVSYVVLALSLIFFVNGEGKLKDLPSMLLGLSFVPALVFCSTPNMTLRAKNILIAICFTAGLPWMIVMLALGADWLASYLLNRGQLFLEIFSDTHPAMFWTVLAILASGYCATQYRAGYRAFMTFQVVESQEQEVQLPASVERAIAPWTEKVIPGYTGPIASLIRKELRLHRVSFLLVAFAIVVEPILAIAWKIHPSEILIGLLLMPVVVCALGVPIVTGIISVAEERNLGVTAWQLTQPVSKALQWAVKLFIAFSTCVALGVIFPYAMVIAGQWLSSNAISYPTADQLEWYSILYITFFSLVVYTSTISPNAIRAMVTMLGLLAASGAIFAVFILLHQDTTYPPQSAAYEKWGILWLTEFVVVFNLCSFVNFRAAELNSRRMMIQMLILLVCVIVTCLSGAV